MNDVMADSICKLETDMENSWVSLEDEIYDIDDRIDDLESENESKNASINLLERMLRNMGIFY